MSSGELQQSPVKVAQKLPRKGQLKQRACSFKEFRSKSSKKMTNGKQKDETESGGLKKTK